MAKSSFLATLAYLNVLRADYSKAHAFAVEATQYCTRLRLAFALPICTAYRVKAAIGLRAFSEAHEGLDELSRWSVALHDPYVELAERSLRIKLRLAEGVRPALDQSPPSGPNTPPSAVGDYRALRAIAAAVAGNARLAEAEVRAATSVTNSIEARYYARFAEIISRDVTGDPTADRGDAMVTAFTDAHKAGNSDAFVVAYRAHPPLLRLISRDADVSAHARRIIHRAHDESLARKHRLTHEGNDMRLCRILTRRETEVLRLMSDGLTNAEIAKRLFISESTAKVHVHHVLEKLGARNRIDAVLKGKEADSRAD